MQLAPARAVWLAALLVFLLVSGVLALVYVQWYHSGLPRVKSGEKLHSTVHSNSVYIIGVVYMARVCSVLKSFLVLGALSQDRGKGLCDECDRRIGQHCCQKYSTLHHPSSHDVEYDSRRALELDGLKS